MKLYKKICLVFVVLMLPCVMQGAAKSKKSIVPAFTMTGKWALRQTVQRQIDEVAQEFIQTQAINKKLQELEYLTAIVNLPDSVDEAAKQTLQKKLNERDEKETAIRVIFNENRSHYAALIQKNEREYSVEVGCMDNEKSKSITVSDGAVHFAWSYSTLYLAIIDSNQNLSIIDGQTLSIVSEGMCNITDEDAVNFMVHWIEGYLVLTASDIISDKFIPKAYKLLHGLELCTDEQVAMIQKFLEFWRTKKRDTDTVQEWRKKLGELPVCGLKVGLLQMIKPPLLAIGEAQNLLRGAQGQLIRDDIIVASEAISEAQKALKEAQDQLMQLKGDRYESKGPAELKSDGAISHAKAMRKRSCLTLISWVVILGGVAGIAYWVWKYKLVRPTAAGV